MFLHNIKIALKNLWNNKKYTAINVLGFAFSLSIFLTIILFVLHEKSFDSYHSKSNHIYRLIDTEENSSAIDYRVNDILREQFTEVKNSCFYLHLPDDQTITYKENGYAIKGISSTNESFFEIFDIEFIYGNSSKPFENINSVILTEEYAVYLFGNENPIGKELILHGTHSLVVSGVIKEFAINSSFETQLIVNAENDNFKFYHSRENSEDLSTYRWHFDIYMQLHTSSKAESLVTSLNDHIESLAPYVDHAGLLPLRDIYLNDTTWGSSSKRGNPNLLKLLMAIAGVILLLAIINYINLTLAQQSKRNKEIGIRKTIGASRNNLINQFLFESLIVISMAFGFSLLLFELCYPLIENLFKVSLKIGLLSQLPYSLFVAGSILLLGFVTGISPALLFSSFNPINIFGKGMIPGGRKRFSRNFLTVFQFTVSIALVFCALVIWKQIAYSKQIDLGFNKDQLLRIKLPPPMDQVIVNESKGFINAIKHYSSISDITSSLGVPGEVGNHMGSVAIIYADMSFLNTFDIKIIQGRDFLASDEKVSCLLNKTAYEYFEWDDIENKRYEKRGGFDVVGIVEDFHLTSIHHEIKPTAIIFDQDYITHATIKIRGDKIGETLAFVKDTWNEHLSEFPLSYTFYDDWFNNMYEKEESFGKIISYFTILGIIISCIGIFGLAIFNAERKTKEIGIRKVNGATVRNVLVLLTREYTFWVLIAFVIAAPLATILMNMWLREFAYRTEISWEVFILTGVIAIGIAWASVIWHSLRAALGNPVDALRYE